MKMKRLEIENPKCKQATKVETKANCMTNQNRAQTKIFQKIIEMSAFIKIKHKIIDN